MAKDDKSVDKNTRPGGTSSNPPNESLPGDFDEKAKERFAKLTKPEFTFDQYLDRERNEFLRLKALEANPALKYKPDPGKITPCGNGDVEKSLDPTEWQGANGVLPLPAVNPFASFTSGIFSGAINLSTSHQTWVPAGADPNVGIPTTAQGSAGAVRIGNAVNGYGCELLSKTFVVTPAVKTIKLWYAVVLQNPLGHPPNIQPFFWVRVTDASGNIVPGAFDFGTGTAILIADTNNPFFQSKVIGQETVVYRDWSCAEINLTKMVGKQVTIEFVTADCGAGGHWGYAYIDNFCGDCSGSPGGDITYDCEASTHCGPGQICFNYTLPATKDPAGNIITGTVTITLEIYQNGVLLTKLTSPTLNSGNSFCFKIDPAAIPGINLALGGFDFVATGAFAIGSTPLGHITIGAPPDGINDGLNNDYEIACKTCEEIEREQDGILSKKCGKKFNFLPRANCDCPKNIPHARPDCVCDCTEVKFPDIQPCISVKWGDSQCDCFETDDVEVLCITVCNCYSNVTFNDLSIGHIGITDMDGNPVPTLPDGTPSVQAIPSGPICFGDIPPCRRDKPGCVSREIVLYTRGAIGKDYLLSFEGVCFSLTHHFQSEHCFIVRLCQD